MATIILGAQWGDEGKGKIVDVIAQNGVQLCCRAQGGHNAGHTIVKNGKKFDVHILPSGVLTDGCVNLVGTGCVVHVPNFFKEIEQLEKEGINTKDRILVSDRCHVDLDLHTKVDGLEEVELGKANIGTTGKGIGPTYSTKASRTGVRMADVFTKEIFDSKVKHLYNGYKKRYGDLLQYDPEEEIARFDKYREQLKSYVVDQIPLIDSAVEGNVKILVEGSQAALLDLDNGTYPYVTSSNTGLGGVMTGLQLSPRKIDEIIGVVKAYTTRVGSGPFPTELQNEIGDKLVDIGKEYGVTTGRKRRCGWLDLVVVKLSHSVNRYDSINLTKLDILDDFDELKVATEYHHNGRKLNSFPTDLGILEKVDITYQTFPGWKSNTVGIKDWNKLPENARKYVEFIEKFVGVRVKYIGTGPGNENMIIR